jgi:hypothetical protein
MRRILGGMRATRALSSCHSCTEQRMHTCKGKCAHVRADAHM